MHLFLIIALICYAKHKQISLSFQIKTIKKKPNILFSIFTETNSDRIPTLMDIYGKQMLKLGYSLFFVNYEGDYVPKSSKIIIPNRLKEYLERDRNISKRWSVRGFEIANRFFYFLHYFDSHKEYDWIYRGTDDAFINYKLIPNLQDELTNFSINSPVILGNCLKISETSSFSIIQGGSGWIMNRAAVNVFLKEEENHLRNFAHADDFEVLSLIQKCNLSLKDVSSNRFIGRYPIYNQSLSLAEGIIPKIQKCPKELPDQCGCAKLLFPIKDLIFLHFENIPNSNFNFTFKQRADMAKLFLNISDPSLSMYLGNKGEPILCHNP